MPVPSFRIVPICLQTDANYATVDVEKLQKNHHARQR